MDRRRYVVTPRGENTLQQVVRVVDELIIIADHTMEIQKAGAVALKRVFSIHCDFTENVIVNGWAQ